MNTHNSSTEVITLCQCGCGNPAPISKQSDTKRGVIKGHSQRFIRGHQPKVNAHSVEANVKRSATMKAVRANIIFEMICPHPERKHYAKGLCHSCYQTQLVKGKPRTIPTCGHPDRRHAGRGMCHSCYMMDWIKRHPESNSGKGWMKNHVDEYRVLLKRQGFRKYGITLEEFESLWDQQDGKCANPQCASTYEKSDMSRKKDGLHVDHDHLTNKVRGLLCRGCNTALGHVDDSIARLRGLIAYLESHAEPA